MSSSPFTVKAVFEYSSGHEDDLSFSIGQIITVTAVEDDDWYYGEYPDEAGGKQEGIFPKNFVEKYEPPAPPRPTRPSRPKKEPEPVPEPQPTVVTSLVVESHPSPELEVDAVPTLDSRPVPPPPQSPTAVVAASPPPKLAVAPTPAPAPQPPKASEASEPAPKPAAKPPPPAVAEKPTGSSFRDRIAAFNKPAAPPIAPFKPGGYSSQSTNFIKKPFVAPPPSKNAYVPPPREPPSKVYRREEDPDVQDRPAPEPPVSEFRPVPTAAAEEGAGDQPKPTSLKERIALLQKQQMEQAARHAEAAQKKEKPKRPPKKRTEPHEEDITAEDATPESPESIEPVREHSTDTIKAGAPSAPQPAVHPQPVPDIASDTNDADDSAAADTEDAEEISTGKEDLEKRSHATEKREVEKRGDIDGKDEGDEEEEEEEEEEDIDPEIKRKMELRERMAKMSGGMGMMGFFGPPGGMALPGPGPRKPKAPVEAEKTAGDSETLMPSSAPPVPVMALPGMNTGKPLSTPSVEKDEEDTPLNTPPEHNPYHETHDEDSAEDDAEPPHRDSIDKSRPPPRERRLPPPLPPMGTRPGPPIPQDQPLSPPPVPGGRPLPPPPPAARSPTSADPGEESDDELSVHTQNLSLNAATDYPAAPPVPAPSLPDHIDSRHSSAYDVTSPKSPTLSSEKRLSRAPPPVPTNPPAPTQSRPPPPPPPGHVRRRSTADSRTSAASQPRQAGEDVEGEVTEYEGDYDTDIASGAKFKDALKAHGRDSSLDEGTMTDDHSVQSPRSPTDARPPPPLPPTAPRAVPPPPPAQPPKSAGRASLETPRGPPPLPPPQRELSIGDEDEYDPYRYTAPQHGLPAPKVPPVPLERLGMPPAAAPPPPPAGDDSDDLDESSPVQTIPHLTAPLPPPPTNLPPSVLPPLTPRSNRASFDAPRGQPAVRRSMDVGRPSLDQGYIAMDVDFAESSLWWTQPNTPPPSFQGRQDIRLEVEESSSSKRGGKTTVTKDVYILFRDYSQTIINVSFDARNPADASLEQRHESPPHPPRQDQLENAHVQIGTRISSAVNAIQNTTVGDGTPLGLVHYLLEPLSDALRPVGSRAYGALVYCNIGNASVQQNDEIRAGDIVSFRNARFQGHKGTMHQKYSAEVGKPDHVGIVVDWDGTKKKIRAWEQGRESKKVKMESFKLNDLRSGECRVWRVMPRSWVGWES